MSKLTPLALLCFLSLFILSGCGTQSSSVSVTSTAGIDTQNQAQYSLSDVAGHNLESDCWTVVSGKVYNITPYVNSHPGGKEKILKGCGVDSTDIFNAKHQPGAFNNLKNYLIGSLK